MLRNALLAALLSSVACNGTHLVTPIAQPPSIEDVVKTCAFAVSCLKNPPTTQLGVCANVLRRALASQEAPATSFPTYVACARDAADCSSVLTCASRGHDPSYCAAHPGPSCDGDLLVYCAAPGGIIDWTINWTDCAALGMHCMEANGAAVCSDGTKCDPALTPPQCAGNTYVSCDGVAHLLFREDCARSGIVNATCRIDTTQTSTQVGCFPSGPNCQSSADRCDGDVLVSCLAGEEQRIDCSAFGSHCVIQPVSSMGECAIVDCTTGDACAGGSLTTCVDGAAQSIDCSAIGLSICTTTSDGRPACG